MMRGLRYTLTGLDVSINNCRSGCIGRQSRVDDAGALSNAECVSLRIKS